MEKIYARNCTVRAIELTTANEFLEKNHRQGATGSKAISLGIFLKNRLLGVVQFSSARTAAMKEKYARELLRLAFLENLRVVGGASKLIKFYVTQYRPADFFTYQDTSGEITPVYEHAGMTLVSQAKKKQYLVAPGKTIKTGSRKEVLGMPYATRYGPDRIIGTKLGEVFREDGSRKSNKELFLEDLGWHLEETSGDRLYEWINSDYTYYTYKITATDSDKYYYGVSHVKKANATAEDCRNDGYMGSGGGGPLNKFQNWKVRHKSTLTKEVISLFDRAHLGYAHERILIGDSYKTDPLCLNSTFGGRDGGIRSDSFKINFIQKYCERCEVERTFRGEICLSCNQVKSRATKWCEVCENDTMHLGVSCYKCASRRAFSSIYCERCEEPTVHRGKNCTQCSNRATVKEEFCSVCKKKTKHQGDNCSTCISNSLVSLKECSTHGLTKHQGEKCSICNSLKSVTMQWCDTCLKSTKHQGSKCNSCLNNLRIGLRWCDSCAEETKHNGGSCYKCSSKPNLIFCEKCAKETFHNGTSCAKCAGAAIIKLRNCDTCGVETKHRGMKCLICQAKAPYYSCEPCGGKITRHKKSGICYLCERREVKKISKAKDSFVSEA